MIEIIFANNNLKKAKVFSSYDDALGAADQWFENATAECIAGIEETLNKVTLVQKDKGHKSGWIFYQMKDFYGYDLASEFVEK